MHNEPVFAETWLTHVLLKHKDHNGSLFNHSIFDDARRKLVTDIEYLILDATIYIILLSMQPFLS